MSPDSLERHWYWPEAILCLPKMLLDQQISTRECSTASYFLPRKSSYVIQRKKISFVPDFLRFDFLVVIVVVVIGTQVKHNVVENSTEVFDLVMLHPHIINSHGS